MSWSCTASREVRGLALSRARISPRMYLSSRGWILSPRARRRTRRDSHWRSRLRVERVLHGARRGSGRPNLGTFAHARPEERDRALVDDRSNHRLERAGCSFLWMEAGGFGVAVKAWNALRRGEVVVSPVDQSQSQDNAVVEFFGAPAAFPRGLAVLAKTSGAPLVDYFVYREAKRAPGCRARRAFHGDRRRRCGSGNNVRLERSIRADPTDWSSWHVFDPVDDPR